ncbi:MFS general substrate transporter [Xylona heveae TC161]|uniref:MFS general substrate transporter n=1 Tax=Xylona heveae (strain CBS 132557 / TC161) TaxID=1328760 RepID=A0A165IT63_XYLHT|nr:MFS general substrate transporter [Xylona heveae TC161]KZF25352.1 MFS general substrate transporter [Xylona heveae TC161]
MHRVSDSFDGSDSSASSLEEGRLDTNLAPDPEENPDQYPQSAHRGQDAQIQGGIPTQAQVHSSRPGGDASDISDISEGEDGTEEEKGREENGNTSTASQTGEEKEKGGMPSKDPNLVTWSSPSDPGNPQNWSLGQKWAVTFVVSLYTFISPVSSSMIAPALGKLSADLGIHSETEAALCMSIFVLAYAIGPLVLGPLSEVFGRVYVLHASNAFYLAWNLGCGFATNKGEMIAFRFLSGLGGSAPLAVGGGVLGDCWSRSERGKAMGIYALAPLLGPVVGPIAGGFIAEKVTWKWVFWATSIVAGVVQIIGLWFLRETYAPVLLKTRAARLRRETGNGGLYTAFDSEKKLAKVLGSAMIRPFRLLATQPIIQLIAIYMAYLFGTVYLILSTFPRVWQDVYGENVGIAGLNYLSLGIGAYVGAQSAAQLNDRIYRRLCRRGTGNDVENSAPDAQSKGIASESKSSTKTSGVMNSSTSPTTKAIGIPPGKPEYRVPLMFVASALIPIGLFWYGWSVESRLHWIMPNIGVFILFVGTMVCLQCMQTYILDSYTLFAASGIAAAVVLRSLAGFAFPLFAPSLYAALGDGWGNSVLAFISIGVGIPAPWIFWFWGEKLRSVSRFAAG